MLIQTDGRQKKYVVCEADSVLYLCLQVLDYTQYYLDLETANTANAEPVWQSEYNLTTYYYGLGEVSAVALHNLADRFTNPEDMLFAK